MIVGVGVLDGVRVGVFVGVAVAVSEGVAVGVFVGATNDTNVLKSPAARLSGATPILPPGTVLWATP